GPNNVYNLADAAVRRGRYWAGAYAYFPLTEEERQSLFILTFPMTCPEYEDSLFVLEGLSHQGKPLPPLRLRLNYNKISYDLLVNKINYGLLIKDYPEVSERRLNPDDITVPDKFRDKTQSYADQFRQAVKTCADVTCFMQYLPVEFPVGYTFNSENIRNSEPCFLGSDYDRFNGQLTMTWRYIVPITEGFNPKYLDGRYRYDEFRSYDKLRGIDFLPCRLQVNFDEHNKKTSHQWLDKICELL
ncbi:MAG: hypothetical protein LBD82_01910, partial [Deltaproteobacteria bacterium]|nr:hypothetical protein [Deltaproteobacteria bacterium]